MPKVTKPSIQPTFSGDLLKRANLYRFMREYLTMSNMPEGYYLEFGVLNGEAMIDAYRQFRGVITHYFGFDSFEGLPELEQSDREAQEYTPHFYKGNFKSMTKEYVSHNIMSCSQMRPEELTLTAGYFSDVLPTFDKRSLRDKGVPLCVYIDCDLYSSTKDVLTFIDDLVVTGTWILFDDYWFYRGSPRHGEQKAMREWIQDHPRIGLSDYGNFNGCGRAFIVYEK
jgi:hypothetical protein